nr:hypothetical protein [uncultured Methanolobus sp.]
MSKSNDRHNILMSFLMLLLTVDAVIIAVNTYHISQNQLQVDKINHQPHFIFNDYKDDYNNFEWIIVSNDGFHVNAIQGCVPITFFEIEYVRNNVKVKKPFVVSGYLGGLQWRGDITKEELIVIGDMGTQPHQWDDFYEDYPSKWSYETGSNRLLHEAREEIESNETLKNMSARLYIKKYIYINYTDVYYEQHQQAYSFDDLYYPKLTDEERIQVWNLYEECCNKGNIVDLNDFNMKYLLYKLNENIDSEENSILKYPFSSDVLITSHSEKE